MKHRSLRSAISLVLLNGMLALPLFAQKKTHSADTVVLHGKIYTLNPEQPWA